jgi:hypothetical protein
MKKIIMIQEKKSFKRPLLKCIKLHVFSVKLSSYFFLLNAKDVWILKKPYRTKIKVFHLDKI